MRLYGAVLGLSLVLLHVPLSTARQTQGVVSFAPIIRAPFQATWTRHTVSYLLSLQESGSAEERAACSGQCYAASEEWGKD